jgi:hypothetical protein
MRRNHFPSHWPALGTALVTAALAAVAAEGPQLGNPAKLPAPAPGPVSFERDIWPILENHCVRCHGPEKPKSRYRLDNREAATAGGKMGVAIVPGNSAASSLVHFSARIVPGLEMPPVDEGKPLTNEQVALLRAWIDDGAKWGDTKLSHSSLQWSFTAGVGYNGVDGDEKRFRELNWLPNGWIGGVEEFRFDQREGEVETHVDARIIGGANNYQIHYDVSKRDLGFIRFGAENVRKFSDDSGGWYPLFTQPFFEIGDDPTLDVGRTWIDFGLQKSDWPQITIGYEYQWKDGTKSLTSWGPVTEGLEPDGFTPLTRNIYPTQKGIDEQVHILKLDIDHTLGDWRFADSFRGTWADTKTQRGLVTSLDLTAPGAATSVLISEGHQAFTLANALSVERRITSWLVSSAGYLYSKHDADATFSLDGSRAPGTSESWQSSQIVLERQSQVGNLNAQIGPWSGTTLALGAQGEWTQQRGMEGLTIQTITPFAFTVPLQLNSDLDTRRFTESAVLRCVKIPFTTLFAEVRAEQETVGQFEQQTDLNFGTDQLLRDTDADTMGWDWRAGFTTAPWRTVSFGAHYRQFSRDVNYNHPVDQFFGAPDGYSAFIRGRNTVTDEVEARVVYRPVPWLRTAFTYQLQQTDYDVTTDPWPGLEIVVPGGPLQSGSYDSHVLGANAAFTLVRNLSFTANFTYQHLTSSSFANYTPSVTSFSGDTYTVTAAASYTIDAKTDVTGSYTIAWADYLQPNYVDGLPLGPTYSQQLLQAVLSRQLRPNLRVRLGYAASLYRDDTTGGYDNYTAHGVFGSLTWRMQ